MARESAIVILLVEILLNERAIAENNGVWEPTIYSYPRGLPVRLVSLAIIFVPSQFLRLS